MNPLPLSQVAPVIRTEFSDHEAWEAIRVAERAGLSRQEARAGDDYAVLLLETTH